MENEYVKLELIDTYQEKEEALPFYWWNIISKSQNIIVGTGYYSSLYKKLRSLYHRFKGGRELTDHQFPILVMNIIEIKGLEKQYKRSERKAIAEMSLAISKGEIVALMGPNGSGKSTLIKIMLGVIRPTAGEVKVLGVSPLQFKKEEKRKIGVYLGGKSNLIFHLPVIDSLNLFASIYKVGKNVFEERIEKYGKLLKCEEYLRRQVSTLSLGEKLRAELLCLLIYEPEVIFLDEPTLGLDIEGKRKFREILSELVKELGVTIFITTHDINDMEKFCIRIVFIKEGRKLLDISKDAFEEIVEGKRVLVTDVDTDVSLPNAYFLEETEEGKKYLVSKTTKTKL